MTRMARLLRLAIWRQFLGWSGAWWFIVALVLSQAVTPLLGLFVWLQVPGGGDVGSYYLAVLCVALMTASYENHTFAQSIYSGDVVAALVRPQPTVLDPLGENLAIRIWMAVLGLPLVIGVGFSVGVHYRAVSLLIAIPAVLIAGVLQFLFVWTLAMTAFWSERVHAVVGFGSVLTFLLGGSAAPVDRLPDPLRTVAMVLPFRSMLGFPAELATGGIGLRGIAAGFGVAVLWVGILGGCAVLFWRTGLRRYSSVGA